MQNIPVLTLNKKISSFKEKYKMTWYKNTGTKKRYENDVTDKS